MDEKNIKLPIRSSLIPVFYQKFHCLGGACRDNCCVYNWQITFDKNDYLRLRRLDAPPALREKLERVVRRRKKEKHDGVFYGEFDLESNGGRCPFLDEDGLCSIQRACGHDALPKVCTDYPRKVGFTTAAREHSLSPSCEGVLQQLWDLPEGVEFVEDPLPKTEWRNANISPGDNLLLYFEPVRALFIDILQNRAMSLTERMLRLGVIIQRLQMEDWSGFDPDRWAEQAMLLAESDAVKEMKIPGNREMYLTQNLNVLDVIAAEKKSNWPNEIYNALNVRRELVLPVITAATESAAQNASSRVRFSPKAYEDALTQFRDAFSDHEYFFENLMVAAALYLNFPKLSSKEELWKSYVSLCNLYSFYRFVSVLGCTSEATKERLFHMIVMASRATLHNRSRFNRFQEELFQHDSSTLAHMAILLCWD